MSYHVQQSSQQKSLGIIVVVAFHIVLVFALITGLKAGKIISDPENITYTNVKEKPVEVPPIEAPTVDFNEKTNIIVPVVPVQTFENETLVDTQKIVTTTTGGTAAQPTMSKPKLQNATTPAYPAASVRLEEQGTTRLNLYITADGRVSEATVVSSSGYSRLDDAAVKHALHSWRFTPCVDNGTAVGCWFQTNLVWKLENAKR